MQGTAGITLAGMINATKLKGAKLKDQKYLFLGAGSAGIGLANMLVCARCARHDAKRRAVRIYMFDINGLLEPSRKDLVDFQSRMHKARADEGLRRSHRELKPTTMIGVSTNGGAFTQNVVETMSGSTSAR